MGGESFRKCAACPARLPRKKNSGTLKHDVFMSQFPLDENRVIAVLVLAAAACYAAPASNSVADDDKESATPTTHALLSKLGMQRLHLSAGHHRKRLAEQGRRQSSGDSRMFVIKLPPNTNYYSHALPAPAAARTLALPLHSNGKPARVYHWNLPVLQKLASEKGRHQARLDDEVDVESTPTWSKPHPNAIEAPSYYVPAKPKKSSFRKYFSGNGKPKSFYLMDKSKKPTHYHRLLP